MRHMASTSEEKALQQPDLQLHLVNSEEEEGKVLQSFSLILIKYYIAVPFLDSVRSYPVEGILLLGIDLLWTAVG